MKLHRTSTISILFIIAFSWWGCESDAPFGLQSKPNAIGPTNQVNVIADQSLWDSPVGDTVDYYFSSPFPLLPQPEPMYDLQHFVPSSLQQHPARKELRTFVLLVNTADTSSRTTKLMKADVGPETWNRITAESETNTIVGRDRWANGQLLIYLFGSGIDQLTKSISNEFNAISERINKFDSEQVKGRLYVQGENKSLMDSIRNLYQIDIPLPAKFQLAIREGGFTWLRWERERSSNSLIFYSVPYRDSLQLTPQGLKRLRDSLGRKYVSGGQPNSYMTINDQDLPVFFYTRQIDEQYALEARGIWEMRNAFLGGPFVSYLIYDRSRGRLVFVDGFVYAPGEEKRELMDNLIHILRNIEIVPPSTAQ